MILVAHATVDDELGAVPERLGKARGRIGALLVAVVQRGVRAIAGGNKLVDADRRIDHSAAGKSKMLIVAGYVEECSEVGRGVADFADGILLRERVVDAIAVRVDPVCEQ